MTATADENDAGLIREELGALYAKGWLITSEANRADRLVSRLARLLGWTREAVIAQAIKDAEQLEMMG